MMEFEMFRLDFGMKISLDARRGGNNNWREPYWLVSSIK